ncbi:MAG: ADP-ribosylation factor-like protein [Candidatus Kariarchaeaceae archaeon]|jgi:hypothetical protein
MKKLIFAGLDKAGKTTIYKSTMEEMSVQELEQQRPTRGIERHTQDFLDRDFSVWDLGGQINYRETYLSKPEVFNQTAALIFVVDIQDIERLEEAYNYYVDIINILINVEPVPKLYVFFHKFDPELVGKLRAHFYKATRMFRQADHLIRQKFKGYATSIYSNSINLAVKRILFENFEDYQEPTGSVKVRPQGESAEESSSVPLPGASSVPTPVPKAEKTPTPTVSDKPDEQVPVSVATELEEKGTVTSEEELSEEQKDDLERTLAEATPQPMDEFSADIVEKVTNIIEKRMKETPEIVALSILSSTGKQALAVGKSEIDYDRLATLREVVSSLNPKQFFKDLTDIEYRGLGHFSLSDFDIYFARASDDFAIAVLATDVSTLMLQNAQKIVKSIRQALGMVSDEDTDSTDDAPKTSGKRDLVADLKGRLKSISGLDNI